MERKELKREPKKSAIVSLGTRITLDSKNVRSVDLKYMRQYLLHILGRSEVDYLSKKSKKEEGMDYYKDIETTDLNDYDEVFIYNATLNPFGGLFKYEALITFEKLYTYNGDIYYFQIDPKMPNADMAKFLQGRNKKKDYVFGCDLKALDFKHKIDPEILDNWTEKVWKRTNIAFDGVDYPYYCSLWNKANEKHPQRKMCEDVTWTSMPIASYYSVNEELETKLKDYDKKGDYDLVYFGNNRNNERNKIIKKLYDIPEYKKLCIGFDPKIENTDVLPYIKHDELFKTIGEQCLATIVIGDPMHNGNIKSARFFESMLLDVIAFIYNDYDPKKEYVKDEFLKDFIYISTKEELEDRIKQIKNDPTLYKKIVDLERKEILDQYGYMKK